MESIFSQPSDNFLLIIPLLTGSACQIRFFNIFLIQVINKEELLLPVTPDEG